MVKFRNRSIIISFIIVLAIFVNFTACSTEKPYTAGDTELSMSEDKYKELCTGMYAVTTPDLVFADDEKVVLHLQEGIFVYNYKNREMENCFDISSLNCHTNMQGSYGLYVKVSEDGKTALLVSYGDNEDSEKRENYYLNLEDGSYKVTKDTKMENYFNSFEKGEYDEFVYPKVAIVGEKRISCVDDNTNVTPMGNHKLLIREADEETEIYLFK